MNKQVFLHLSYQSIEYINTKGKIEVLSVRFNHLEDFIFMKGKT